MPDETGTVTEVGVGNIQFYIPNKISTHSDCLFDPGDEFRVQTVRDVGLLITPTELTPTVADLLNGLELDLEETAQTDDPDILTTPLD